jgi:hypothetical protein
LFLLLNGNQVAYRSFGIALVEVESRHVGVNGGQPILQSLSEVVVVKFLSESPKGWGLRMRALTGRAHGMTACAQRFEQNLASLMLLIKGMAGPAARANHQEREAEFIHWPRPRVGKGSGSGEPADGRRLMNC